jgi:hypothetical protein
LGGGTSALAKRKNAQKRGLVMDSQFKLKCSKKSICSKSSRRCFVLLAVTVSRQDPKQVGKVHRSVVVDVFIASAARPPCCEQRQNVVEVNRTTVVDVFGAGLFAGHTAAIDPDAAERP